MSSEGSRPETIVVGAGLIGLAVAFELLRSGRAVTVLERGRAGHGAGRAGGGMLVSVAEAETDEVDLEALGRESLSRYPEVVASLERISQSSVAFYCEECLWVAANHDDLEEMDRVERALQAKPIEVERLSAEQLSALEPRLSGRLPGGLRLKRGSAGRSVAP